MTASALLSLADVGVTDEGGFETRLQGINLEITAGDRLGIAGPTGSGKSTLLRVMNGLQPVSHGKVCFKGLSLNRYAPPTLRQQVMLVPQEPKLLKQTVQETLCYPLQLQQYSRSECQQRLQEICDFWQIPDGWLDRNELQLSTGQRHLVTLARGSMTRAPMLLLDEPTAPLDSDTAQRVIQRLITLNERDGVTIIMVNHTPDYLNQFAQRQIFMAAGKIVRESHSRIV